MAATGLLGQVSRTLFGNKQSTPKQQQPRPNFTFQGNPNPKSGQTSFAIEKNNNPTPTPQVKTNLDQTDYTATKPGMPTNRFGIQTAPAKFKTAKPAPKPRLA